MVPGPWSLARLERTFLLLLAASFTLPLLLGSLLLGSHNKSTATLWLRNRSLSGMHINPEPVSLSRSSLLSGRCQSALARDDGVQFTGRELMIRLVDEVYLRFFRTSPTGILVGPNTSLIEPVYAQEYCFSRHAADTFRPLVEDLRRLAPHTTPDSMDKRPSCWSSGWSIPLHRPRSE